MEVCSTLSVLLSSTFLDMNQIAIYGYDFCTAACKAVKLLIRNILT